MHNEETRAEAIRRIERGQSIRQVSRDLGLHRDTIRRWLNPDKAKRIKERNRESMLERSAAFRERRDRERQWIEQQLQS
jgi:transposase-like protein